MAKKKVSGVGAILGYQSRADMAVAEAIEAGEKVALSPLFSILPDPDQPWDLLPDHLYDRLYEGESPPTVMQSWLSLAKAGEASPAHERAVASLEQLAPTIAQHDLIQPIVICGADKIDIMLPDGVIYVIVAGERRWWAHVWLYTKNKQIKGREADHIRAVAIAPGSNIRAMQLIENTMRENLTAIERAHGLNALREEMSRDKDRLVIQHQRLTCKTGRNEFGGVYGELYREFGITSYKLLPANRFEEAMHWLGDWYAQVTGSDEVPF